MQLDWRPVTGSGEAALEHTRLAPGRGALPAWYRHPGPEPGTRQDKQSHENRAAPGDDAATLAAPAWIFRLEFPCRRRFTALPALLTRSRRTCSC